MIDIVVPTIGRRSLARLLRSIGHAAGPRPRRIILVDDRRIQNVPLETGALDADMCERLTVLACGGRGPAAARNIGWRASRARWVAFLDDDVLTGERWLEELAADLADLPLDVAASTGRVHVPLPCDRRPTDWERNVAQLEHARWITADCAYRRSELLATGGFDERFPRAFREDADIALRIVARGKRIIAGTRRVTHPVRSARWTVSVALQAGNADDVLMDALHGPAWRVPAQAPRGALTSHRVSVGAALFAAGAFALGKPKLASVALATWAVLTGAFAWRRIAPGPRTPAEIAAMVVTSCAIPFAAVAHRVIGRMRLRAMRACHVPAPLPTAAAVFFDRDGTLIEDVPFNADPARVTAMPDARAALERLRDAGIPTAVVTNQSGVSSGALHLDDVRAVNERVEMLLGPLGPIFVCAHGSADGCACRKPAPGLIEGAARALHVAVSDCVVIGDIGSDIDAARSAGARSILVATAVTRAEEVSTAPLVRRTLNDAVSAVLDGTA